MDGRNFEKPPRFYLTDLRPQDAVVDAGDDDGRHQEEGKVGRWQYGSGHATCSDDSDGGGRQMLQRKSQDQKSLTTLVGRWPAVVIIIHYYMIINMIITK